MLLIQLDRFSLTDLPRKTYVHDQIVSVSIYNNGCYGIQLEEAKSSD